MFFSFAEEDCRGHHIAYNKSSLSSRHLPPLRPILPALLSHLIAWHHHSHNHMQSTGVAAPPGSHSDTERGGGKSGSVQRRRKDDKNIGGGGRSRCCEKPICLKAAAPAPLNHGTFLSITRPKLRHFASASSKRGCEPCDVMSKSQRGLSGFTHG